MNVCLCIISDGWGGAETVVYELARHLRDKGENVSIVLNQEIVNFYADLKDIELFSIGEFPQYSRKQGQKRFSFTGSRLADQYLWELRRPWYYRSIKKQLVKFLDAYYIEVVHAHMFEAVLLAASLDGYKTPKIATLHGEHQMMGTAPVQYPLLRPLVCWQSRRFKNALTEMNEITSVASFGRNTLERWAPSLKDKSTVIYNGLDLVDMRQTIPSVELSGKFNLLFPGGSKWDKGGDILILALAQIVNKIHGIHLYIALDVPQNDLLRKMVTELGLDQHVTFSGFLSKHEYRKLLYAVDLLVMPSRNEIFPIAHMEAMALGKPIVAGNTGGTPELMKDGRNGILVEPDENEVAQAILRLYSNEDLRREMSKNNLQDIQRFDWANIVAQYSNTYRSIVKMDRR